MIPEVSNYAFLTGNHEVGTINETYSFFIFLLLYIYRITNKLKYRIVVSVMHCLQSAYSLSFVLYIYYSIDLSTQK